MDKENKEKKQKIVVPPYESHRRSSQFEVTERKRCGICQTPLSNFQAEDESTHLWCYNCRIHY